MKLQRREAEPGRVSVSFARYVLLEQLVIVTRQLAGAEPPPGIETWLAALRNTLDRLEKEAP